MKKRNLFFVICALFTYVVNAQSDYSSYLNKAMAALEEGNCESAKKLYNVYKDLSGDSKSSVEALIDNCKSEGTKTFAIGDKIMVDGKIYKVAYVEDGGKHGFAVCENGSGTKPKNDVIPTWSEFKLIKKANKTLKLCGSYWSTRASGSNYHYVFGLGGRGSGERRDDYTYDILLIYRF